MNALLAALPVVLVIALALIFAVVFTRSVLHMMFRALGRLVASHQTDAAID